MTRLEKCELLKSKGYTYCQNTGKIYGVKGKEIIRKDEKGYIILTNHLKGHHFAYFMTYGNVDFIELDHINEDKKGIEGRSDNRICNLRSSNRQKNMFNTNAKGYSWDKSRNKWSSQIMVNGKKIHLGRFDTKEEARNAYLEAKKIYHQI